MNPALFHFANAPVRKLLNSLFSQQSTPHPYTMGNKGSCGSGGSWLIKLLGQYSKKLQLIQYSSQTQLCSQSVYSPSLGWSNQRSSLHNCGEVYSCHECQCPCGHMERCMVGLTHRRTGCLGDKRRLTILAALKSNKRLSLYPTDSWFSLNDIQAISFAV